MSSSNRTTDLDEMYSQLKDEPWADADDDVPVPNNTWDKSERTGDGQRQMEGDAIPSWRATATPAKVVSPTNDPVLPSSPVLSSTPKPGSILAGIFNTLTTDAARIEESLRKEREEQAELKRQVDANWREREAKMREEGERLARERAAERDAVKTTSWRAMDQEINEIRRLHANRELNRESSLNRDNSLIRDVNRSSRVILVPFTQGLRAAKIHQIAVKPSPNQPEIIIQLH